MRSDIQDACDNNTKLWTVTGYGQPVELDGLDVPFGLPTALGEACGFPTLPIARCVVVLGYRMSDCLDTLPKSCAAKALSSCRFRSPRLTAVLDQVPVESLPAVASVCLIKRERITGGATQSMSPCGPEVDCPASEPTSSCSRPSGAR